MPSKVYTNLIIIKLKLEILKSKSILIRKQKLMLKKKLRKKLSPAKTEFRGSNKRREKNSVKTEI